MTSLQKALELLKEQEAATAAPDRLARRDAWIHAVEQLFDRIKVWVEGSAEGLLSVQRKSITVDERYVGPYKIDELILVSPSGERIVFRPIATYVLGADGRIDVEGPREATKLIWNRTDDLWAASNLWWYGVTADHPLSEELFWTIVGNLLSRPSA